MVITPEEFKTRMQSIIDSEEYETEHGHMDMDNLLCETLESLGYHDGLVIYQSKNKWYA